MEAYKVDFCDAGHQAIAFTGGCPMCRRFARFLPLPAFIGTFYVADLRHALRRFFAAEQVAFGAAARAAQTLPSDLPVDQAEG